MVTKVHLGVAESTNTQAGDPGLRTPSRLRSIILIVALCCDSSLALPRAAAAQGISTATIRGTVRTEDGAPVDGARVNVLNTATGVATNTRVARGRFLMAGLDVGGPYVVEVRHIGFLPQRSAPLVLTLGQLLDISFVLQPATTRLERVVITGPSAPVAHGGGGTTTIITDSLLYRLPTLNRGFLDFVQLAPQVSTKVGFQRRGMSAAGANLRFNNYLINGADEHFVNSNVSPAHNAAKSIPIDAVKEYQVLVAPYDVRYGDFAGALVNTVTQSGTNALHGSMFTSWRNNRLARDGALVVDSLRYERLEYGFSLGGPIVRDRVHFFIAPEIQRLVSPAPGPYLGQPSTAFTPVPVSGADVDRFETLMRSKGLDAGSGGSVTVENPLQNLFARVDAAIPRWNSRAIGIVTYSGSQDEQFSRSTLDTFYLSSYKDAGTTRLRLLSLQLQTDIARKLGAHNELLVSEISDRSEQVPNVRQPLVHVLVPGTSGSVVSLTAGTREAAQGGFRLGRSIKIKDELTVPWGARHVLVFGVQAERFRIQPGGVAGGYGTWTFAGLDAFERGIAESFTRQMDAGSASAALRGGQYAAYVGDEWRVGDRAAFTLGLRADLLDVAGRAPYNAAVDSIFGRRTDQMPVARAQYSPRFGFTWDVHATGEDQLRGGVGLFSGRPPLAWLHPALTNYGVGIATLSCGFLPKDVGEPPVFVPDYRNPPTTCANVHGETPPAKGDVDLLDRRLRMAQALRTSLAYDRRLPWNLLSSSELLFTRYVSDFMFVNLNLVGPQAVDRVGRVLYGTIAPSGLAGPAQRTELFREVIDLRNTSANYSYQLSTRVERQFARRMAASVSYTYSRTRDVQSPSRVNNRGILMWADARAISGRHEDLTRGISLNDLPHRAVAALTWTAPWNRWFTGLSFYYVGESGTPFTYVATGNKLGDLNADGSNANDPIYIPRSAADSGEIQFAPLIKSAATSVDTVTVAEQQAGFEQFIRGAACLRRQRGHIMERNSCREPWSHTTIASVQQAVPIGTRSLETELDAFNILNLLNARWGLYRVAAPRLLEQVGQTGGSPDTAQPIFRFDPARAQWTTLQSESAFQLQLVVRLRF